MKFEEHELGNARGVGTFCTIGGHSGAWVCSRGLAMFIALLISLNSPMVRPVVRPILKYSPGLVPFSKLLLILWTRAPSYVKILA